MRCPKCGFHSFDYLDNCKKCGGDLTELKLRCKFQGYVAPAAAEIVPEPEEPAPGLPEVAEAENEAIDFGFDILEEKSAPPQANFSDDADELNDSFAELGAADPSAIDLATDNGLHLDQPFASDSESLPDDELPKFDERF